MVLVLPNGSPAFTRRSYADSYSTIIDDARGVFRSGQLVDKLLRPAPTREAYTVAARGRALLGHHRRASAVAFYIPFERLQAIRLAGREDDRWVPLACGLTGAESVSCLKPSLVLEWLGWFNTCRTATNRPAKNTVPKHTPTIISVERSFRPFRRFFGNWPKVLSLSDPILRFSLLTRWW